MNKWLVIVVLAVVVVGVAVWLSNRNELGLSPASAVKKTTKTTTSPAEGPAVSQLLLIGKTTTPPNDNALKVFGVPA